MFDRLKNVFKTRPQEAKQVVRVVPTEDGRGFLVVDGQVVKVYARARDARRGAIRMGYTLDGGSSF